MSEVNDPEKQAAERDAQLQGLVWKDRRFSVRHSYDIATFVIPDTGHPIAEIHSRGGIQTGFRGPSGEISVLGGNDVVYLYDTKGRLRERFVADNLPEGYTALTQAELQRVFFRRINMPQVGNVIN